MDCPRPCRGECIRGGDDGLSGREELGLRVLSQGVLYTPTRKYRTLQFCCVYVRSVSDPMFVPWKDMERFIHAVESAYYSPEEITPDKYGREVRIVGGILDGYTDRLLRMLGSKVRRLLVKLPGFLVAGVEVRAEYNSSCKTMQG